jgi:3-methyl-2-oxobutanoate hydroxymethyltransferase
VVGKTVEEAKKLLADARALAEAGAFMLVLELVPEEVSQAVCRALAPSPCVVIGIGSGRDLDGEVQVVNDLLGISERTFRHAKAFAAWREQARAAVEAYVRAVRERRFPEERNVTHLAPEVREAIREELTHDG